jgi:hypothetical protein
MMGERTVAQDALFYSFNRATCACGAYAAFD